MKQVLPAVIIIMSLFVRTFPFNALSVEGVRLNAQLNVLYERLIKHFNSLNWAQDFLFLFL